MMKFKLIPLIALLFMSLGIQKMEAQKYNSETPKVYSASDPSSIKKFTQLDLDKTHPNLLDPRIAKDDFQNVVASWTEFHQIIGNSLKQNNFSWGDDIESVKMFQKIYFDANGKITHYLFNINDPKISEEKKEEFGKLLSEIIETIGISYTKEEQFAQCGKIEYGN